MEIKCSQCGFTSNGPDNLAGKKLKCPKCGVEFVASGESAFAVVEDNPAASQYKKAIVEKPIGKIGTLEVTNKRVQGMIQRVIGTRVENANIDVLLNLITGITVNKISSRGKRIALNILASLWTLFCMILGIVLMTENNGRQASEAWMPMLIGAIGAVILCGISKLIKDRIWLTLSISGVNHFIPFQTSQLQEAEEKCKMLKDAKSEYERIACI